MAKNLTETSTHTANVSVPEAADARTAASIETAFQALTNRSKKAKDRLDGLAGARTRLISLAHCRPPDGMGVVPGVNLLSPDFTSAGAYWAWAVNSYRLIVPIALEAGDILTDVSFCVQQGNAGASGQMSAKVFRDAVSASTYATNLQLGSTRTFAAGAGFKNESVAIASSNTIDNTLYHYYAQVTGSALAGTNSDYLHWVKLTYTAYGAP